MKCIWWFTLQARKWSLQWVINTFPYIGFDYSDGQLFASIVLSPIIHSIWKTCHVAYGSKSRPCNKELMQNLEHGKLNDDSQSLSFFRPALRSHLMKITEAIRDTRESRANHWNLLFLNSLPLVSPLCQIRLPKTLHYQVTLLLNNFQWLPIAFSTKSKQTPQSLFFTTALPTSLIHLIFSSSSCLLCAYYVLCTELGAGDMPVNQSDAFTDPLHSSSSSASCHSPRTCSFYYCICTDSRSSISNVFPFPLCQGILLTTSKT